MKLFVREVKKFKSKYRIFAKYIYMDSGYRDQLILMDTMELVERFVEGQFFGVNVLWSIIFHKMKVNPSFNLKSVPLLLKSANKLLYLD